MSLIEKIYAVDLNNAITVRDNDITSINGLVTVVTTWIIYIAGIMAFFYLIYSGILYISAAGNPEQAKKGQQGILNAVIGIIIVTLAFVILKAISGTAGNNTL